MTDHHNDFEKSPCKNTGQPAKFSPFRSFLKLKRNTSFAKCDLYYYRKYNSQSKTLVVNVTVFGSIRCGIERKKFQIFALGILPFLLGSNPKDLEDCVVLVGVFASSVPTTMIQLY